MRQTQRGGERLDGRMHIVIENFYGTKAWLGVPLNRQFLFVWCPWPGGLGRFLPPFYTLLPLSLRWLVEKQLENLRDRAKACSRVLMNAGHVV